MTALFSRIIIGELVMLTVITFARSPIPFIDRLDKQAPSAPTSVISTVPPSEPAGHSASLVANAVTDSRTAGTISPIGIAIKQPTFALSGTRERAKKRLTTSSQDGAGTSRLTEQLFPLPSGGDDGQVLTLKNGAPQWQWLPFSAPRTAPSARTTESDSGGGQGPSRRGGGGNALPTSQDGDVETHDHQNTTAGGQLNIGSATTGVLGQARGGTAFSSYSTGDLLVGSAGGALEKLAVGSSQQVLVSSGGTLVWSNTVAGNLTQGIADVNYINVSGDTMTGTLILNPTSGLALNARGTISGSLITQNGAGSNYFMGNVGIGTTTPSSKLDVINTTSAGLGAKFVTVNSAPSGFNTNPTIMLQNTLSQVGTFTGLYNYSAGSLVNAGLEFINVDNSYQGAIAFVTRSAAGEYGERMRVTHGGNVGIGTTSPKAKLDVVGTISGSALVVNGTQTLNGAATINVPTAATKGLIIKGVASQSANLQEWQDSVGQPYLVIRSDGTIDANTDNYGLARMINMRSYLAGLRIYDQTPTLQFSFFTAAAWNDNVNTAFYSAQQGYMLHSASVRSGINTPYFQITSRAYNTVGAPTAQLEVLNGTASKVAAIIQGAASQSANLQEWQNSAGTTLSFITPSGSGSFKAIAIGKTPVNGRPFEVLGTISGSLITQNGAGDNYFMGNVGIGTTNLPAKLSILQTSAFDSDVGLRVTAGSVSENAKIQLADAGGHISTLLNDSGNFYITSSAFAGGNKYQFTMKGSNGFVGIGGDISLSPGSRLSVGGNAVIGSDSYFNVAAPTNGLLVEGSVGIGTTAPKAKLDVLGTISGSLITQNGAGSNYFMGNVGINDTTPDASLEVVNDGTGDSFLVADSGDGDTTPFVIQSNGVVGIGTIPVGYGRLEVDGGAIVGLAGMKSRVSGYNLNIGINNAKTIDLDGHNKIIFAGSEAQVTPSISLDTGSAWTVQHLLSIKNNAAEKVFVTYDGQVNAGTSGDGLVTKVVAGACGDGNFSTDTDGTLCIDSSNGRIYFRYGSAWHYAAQTAGFQIPKLTRNGKDETEGLSVGDPVIGRIDEVMADGALHGIWEKFDLLTEIGQTLQEHPELLAELPTPSSSSSLSLSDLRDLTLQGVLTVAGNATFLGDVTVRGMLTLDQRQIGSATIVAGQTEIQVTYEQQFSAAPLVTATPQAVPGAFWGVVDVSAGGFTIRLASPMDADLPFSWLAMPVHTDDTDDDADNDTMSETDTLISNPVASGALLPFPIDERGIPLTGNAIEDACLRNQTPLDDNGQPYNCSRYHDGIHWQFGEALMFDWNTNFDPPQLTVPEGYVATVQLTPSNPDEPAVDPEPAVATGSTIEVDPGALPESDSGATIVPTAGE
jgi:hypothetical protein